MISRAPEVTQVTRDDLEEYRDDGLTARGLRRTFVVLLQDAGAPASVIRQALGHAQQGVTEQHYLPRRDPVVQSWLHRIEIREGRRPIELTASDAILILGPTLLQ